MCLLVQGGGIIPPPPFSQVTKYFSDLREDFTTVPSKPKRYAMPYKLSYDECARVTDKAAGMLAQYCVDNDIHYTVVGSSGGLDSAVTLALAHRAEQIAKDKHDFKLTSVGIIMPCKSAPDAERLGRKAINYFGAQEVMIDLTSQFDFAFDPNWADQIKGDTIGVVPNTDQQVKSILHATNGGKALASWDWSQRIAQGNLKARLRMMFGTYHIARMMGGMVLSTDNWSEFMMAFWTICGDVGDYGMIQQMLKGLELYDLAHYLGVPQEIIDAKPDDGLNVGNGDEDQLGADYATIDYVMTILIQNGFDPDASHDQLDSLPDVPNVKAILVKRLATRAINGAFKRHGTVVLTREELGLEPINEIINPKPIKGGQGW